MPEYCTGMSQPPNGTIFAPSRRCSSKSGVSFDSASGTTERLDFASLGVNHASLEEGTGCLYHERYVNWLDKLERRIGFIAIPGLIRIVVGFTALVFILVRLQPEFRVRARA